MILKRQLPEICKEFSERRNFSGTALVRIGDETILEYACGMAHRGFGIQNRIDTKFNTASIGKAFTAAATLLLIEQGEFTFTDTITRLIDLHGTKIPDDVTVEHLLTHTSGIANDVDLESGQKYEDLFIDKPNYALRHTADFLPNFAFKEPDFKAGTKAAYNDCAFILLGLAIEKYSGTDYRTFVTNHIIQPLKLQDTAFCALDVIEWNTAEGYMTVRTDDSITGLKKNIYMFPPVGTPDAGIYSSVGDLDRFIRSFKTGRLLSEEYSGMMMRPHSEHTWQEQWGNGSPVKVQPGYGFDFIVSENTIVSMSKDGAYPGAKARVLLYPKIDVSVCILTNHDCNIWEMHRRMEQLILPAFGIQPYR